ncbi:hypothetical protein Ga0074812_103159 [Parafrankia irregularis]|uniref:Uncharacterized protein n=2 Tax=Parafrankia TaxID=2994362 RepID=A0A0S4QGR1_9ACTN|nr:hypothetical protein Ga0074812_103159 [Parafrankia irregularis]
MRPGRGRYKAGIGIGIGIEAGPVRVAVAPPAVTGDRLMPRTGDRVAVRRVPATAATTVVAGPGDGHLLHGPRRVSATVISRFSHPKA